MKKERETQIRGKKDYYNDPLSIYIGVASGKPVLCIQLRNCYEQRHIVLNKKQVLDMAKLVKF